MSNEIKKLMQSGLNASFVRLFCVKFTNYSRGGVFVNVKNIVNNNFGC